MKKGDRREPVLNVPFQKLKLFSGKNGKSVEPSAEAGPPGAHSKKKKRRRLKKKAAIPLAVVVVAGGAVGVQYFLNRGDGDSMQTYTGSEASRQDIQLTLSATGTIEPASMK